MKKTSRYFRNTAALVGGLAISGLATSVAAQETNFDKLANLPFAEGRPTTETAQILRDELLFQRATQTYLWAMPLIKYARHAGRFGESLRGRLQRSADLEEATRRQDPGDDPEL